MAAALMAFAGFAFVALWIMGVPILSESTEGLQSKSCMKCNSTRLAVKTKGDGVFWPVLPPSLKENKACEKAADSNPLVTCHEACMSAKVTLTTVETNGTQQRVIPYKIVIRGCYPIDASDGRFCNEADAILENVTHPVLKVFDELPYLEVTAMKGRVCFCDKNVCNPDDCANGLFAYRNYCAKVWHFVLMVLALLVLSCALYCCGCCHTRCFCKSYMRTN